MSITGDQINLIIDRVLLATDFSLASDVAANYACAVAKRFSSAVTLANVIDLSVASRPERAVVGEPIAEMRRASSESLRRLANDFSSSGVLVETQMLESRDPAASIVSLAEGQDSDLIILGTHARRGLIKLILGSCAEGVIRHAACPVLTVGPNVKEPTDGDFSFDSIIFATDLAPDAARKAALAVALAQDSLGKIYLCHFMQHPGRTSPDASAQRLKFEAALEKLVPALSYDWCYSNCIVEYGEAASRILDTAKRVKAELIVLGAKKGPRLLTRFEDGIVSNVLALAECPVMTIGSPGI
ncbi:MAG: universal stress protein [Acidobacteriales bacterium]|nr:universal stress protein [Terriglobales bacterium]